MKSDLPEKHGLPDSVVKSKHVFRDAGQVSLTDIQQQVLLVGIARGVSTLAVAPTSSGKTAVGFFAIFGWFANQRPGTAKAVYLVSHRALARQKLDEIVVDVAPVIGLEPHEIVMATGDGVIDGNEEVPSDPLAGAILVATYEKYLGLLSSSGLTRNMSHICFVCDEIQLLGDATRGTEVEILLTILKICKYGQFVGLSSTLDIHDSKQLAEWLDARLVRTDVREIPLNYELRAPSATVTVSTISPDDVQTEEARGNQTTLSVLDELFRSKKPRLPVVVFCTRRQDVFDLAKSWAQKQQAPSSSTNEAVIFDERTSSADDLVEYLPRGFAFHTADLVNIEREIVERRLQNDELKVVFATTTLAYGLNFSFQTVLIHSWHRWNSERRQREPIPLSEFHNMAGRGGRLGKSEEPGRVVFFCSDSEMRYARQYLRLQDFDHLTSRIDPSRFDQVVLQILGAGIITNVEGLQEFLVSTFSAFRERETTRAFDELLKNKLNDSLSRLQSWGFVR